MIFHHNSIRKYTGALLETFNAFEIQYKTTTGELNKKIPIVYAVREKGQILDPYTYSQLTEGNYNILPRANLSLVAITKADNRVQNRNHKINTFRDDEQLQYSFNSVPYEFSYSLSFHCRGMNEAAMIIEQIAPMFNPTVEIDIWDALNLDVPTRIPVRLLDISLEPSPYDELSSNIITLECGISLMGNLYQPIKSYGRIKEFEMTVSASNNGKIEQDFIHNWDVDEDGYIIPGT